MASSNPSIEFGSSTSKLPQKYDVLINFNGEDIRRKFVSHLDYALSTVGLTTFLHEENAVKGMHIQQPILNLCRVAIVVFTKTYSQSAWCLHELQQIIKWQETYSRHVLPVYYEIQPSDVRLQKGDFGKSFKATAQETFPWQQLEHGMSRWSHALTKAANFFGWDERNYRSDAELVDIIIKGVVNLPVLSATKFPVGLQSRVKDVIQIIKNKSTEVCVIGIWGEGGSGKTTLAKAIYHQLHGTFTEKSFIEDISQFSQTRGHVHLQEQLLSDVLNTKIEIRSIEMGKCMIREKLSGKKLLIVLDDTKYDPLLDLCDSHVWLAKGSVIIITAREESLLRIPEIGSVISINLLSTNESLELLSWHAFREAKPEEEYNDLAKSVAVCCGGLPLALEVIGSRLFEKTKEEWKSVLLELKEIHNHDVHRKLKISFDGLSNEMEKDLFLDVCCFFVGKGRAFVTKILNDCGVDADSGIRILIERGLIQVKKNNKLGMQPMLQKMGRKIIRQISGKELGKNPQLWFGQDAEYELLENTLFSSQQTKVIRKLPLKMFLIATRELFEHPSVVRDKSRLLKLTRDFGKLRWISLQGFSSEYLPEDFYLQDAMVIDLKHSLLRFVWKEPQVLMWLTVLNLSHSKYLRETPDFSGLPRLEQLILKDCSRLRKVHHSIGCLNNLVLLNLKDCTSLSNLPREVYKLKSLTTLILSGCLKIDPLEKYIVEMESLIILIAENAAVKQVPFSIVSSKSIGYIFLRGFEGLSCNLFPSIIRSWMSPIMNPLSYIHSFCMDIEDNGWNDRLPLLSTLANLRSVLVQCDTEFQLCKQVETFLIEYGVNVTKSGISQKNLKYSLIGVGRCKDFFDAVSDSISQVFASNESRDVSLPGDNDPYWLGHMGKGHSVSFTVPRDRDLKGMALCVIYLSTPEIVATECLRSVLIVNYTKCTLQIHNHGTVISFNDIDWQGIIPNLGSGDKVEICVTFAHELVVENIVVYLICSELNDSQKEPAPKKNSLIRFIKKVVM
ncbi:disease resistance protein LAZ5 isoform X1 [Vigna radiata var. radiata]|uniref:Disease resistance protein LAZ5 isoform X1 n=1 Tax=Vigna radiata var. radiata TaxID=3916 RepID=A0A1S3VA27_VIGRR|nr:disease resistance protein LAZ5 isoform X1 [Vigna radiata var. radiata]